MTSDTGIVKNSGVEQARAFLDKNLESLWRNFQEAAVEGAVDMALQKLEKLARAWTELQDLVKKHSLPPAMLEDKGISGTEIRGWFCSILKQEITCSVDDLRKILSMEGAMFLTCAEMVEDPVERANSLRQRVCKIRSDLDLESVTAADTGYARGVLSVLRDDIYEKAARISLSLASEISAEKGTGNGRFLWLFGCGLDWLEKVNAGRKNRDQTVLGLEDIFGNPEDLRQFSERIGRDPWAQEQLDEFRASLRKTEEEPASDAAVLVPAA
ncbi:MAG: hypothetical protein M3O22_05685 [Pseudomonadota bacterium]|nr:hypothetical protein [Pseudomonadota bacterium]